MRNLANTVILSAVSRVLIGHAPSSSGAPTSHLARALVSACVAPVEASSFAYDQPITELRRQSRYTESARQQSLRATARR